MYYVDDQLDTKYFDDKYEQIAEWVGHKEEYEEKPGLLSGVFSMTPAEYKRENDFKIYLIRGECDDSGYCNHGRFLVVAVNENTKEVLYQCESW